MFVTRKTYEEVEAQRKRFADELVSVRRMLTQEREDNRALDLVAKKFRIERDSWRDRAQAAEGELERRANQARENFRRGRESRRKPVEQVSAVG